MTVQLPNRDALSKVAGGDQRTIRFFEELTGATNASSDALSGASFGGVGTLAFVRRIVAAQSLIAGTDYAGTDLQYAGFRSNGTTFVATTSAAALSGTWKALGTAIPTGGDFAYTIALRIS
jgi:hypothetical protein